MMQPIVQGIVNVQQGITGIQSAFINVPDTLILLPAFVTYPSSGNLDWPRNPSLRTTTHNMIMDLFVQNVSNLQSGDLPSADQLLKSYIDSVISAFDQNVTLGGNCFSCGVSRYQCGKLQYAGVEYLGIKFMLKVIEKQQVVFAG